MVNIRWFIASAVLSLFMLAVIATPSAHAAPQDLQERAITISPTLIDQTIAPGGIHHGEMQVTNQGETAYRFRVYALPYGVKGEAYQPGFTLLPGVQNASQWFTFDTSTAALEPKTSKTVRYTIRVPVDASAGGHYAVAFAQTQVPAASRGVTPNQRVGVVFYLQVSGDVQHAGSVLEWRAAFRQSSPLRASARIKNDGASHFATQVKVEVRDILGSAKYEYSAQKYLLPQTVRKFEIRWDKTPSLGLFKITGTVDILGKTQNLPVKYVIVIPDLILFIFYGVSSFVVVLGVTRLIVSRRRHKASGHKL